MKPIPLVAIVSLVTILAPPGAAFGDCNTVDDLPDCATADPPPDIGQFCVCYPPEVSGLAPLLGVGLAPPSVFGVRFVGLLVANGGGGPDHPGSHNSFLFVGYVSSTEWAQDNEASGQAQDAMIRYWTFSPELPG